MLFFENENLIRVRSEKTPMKALLRQVSAQNDTDVLLAL